MISFVSLKYKPFHLLFFPLLFVLNHFFSIVTPVNTALMDSFWVWSLNFIGSVVICAGLTYCVYKILSFKFDKTKSAILSTFIFLPFFFLQDLFTSSEQWMLHVRARWFFILVFILLALIGYWVVTSKRQFASLTQYLNVLSISLAFYTTVIVILSFEKLRPKDGKYNAPVYELSCNQCPDIYFFLLDSYTSNKSLSDYFSYDNSDFSEKLRALDFKVSDQAISAYSKTAYSLSAILNLNNPDAVKDPYLLAKSIQHNSVVKSFKKIGYQVRNYSIFDVEDQPAYYSMAPRLPIGCVNGIIQSSILNMVVNDVLLKTTLHETHVDILKKTRKEALTPHAAPQFFYVHLLSPHPPFVTDANGKGTGFFSQPGSLNNAPAYVNQVKGINKLVSAVIENILQASPGSIVIITGDHGYRYLQIPAKNEESYTVFIAYHGPGKEGLDSLKTSNQIFELVFNSFGAKDLK